MTIRDDTSPQIYIPTLHRGLVRRPVPGTVRFLDPGLPRSASAPGLFLPEGYVFSREQSALVLNELLAIGEALDVASPAGKDAARARLRDDAARDAPEKAAIERFAARGSAAAPPAARAENGASAAVAAQKVLLLAWSLEERLLEIETLRHEVAGAVRPLAESLRGPMEGGEAEEELAEALSALELPPETAEPDWRLTLAAIAAFLPEKAVLITAHAGIRAAMLEAGMLHPLPEDAANDLAGWSESEKAPLLWAKAPLWRVIGHSRAPENAPWLLAAPEIIVCPTGGEHPCPR